MPYPNCGVPVLKEIWIQDTAGASAILSLDDSYANNGFIKLYLPPENYQTVNELESTSLVNTGAGTFMNVKLIRRGFIAKFDYDNPNIYMAIRIIAKKHLVEKTLLTVYDWVSPEPEDYINGHSTTRVGIINRPIEHSGLPTIGGFSISFIESKLRYI